MGKRKIAILLAMSFFTTTHLPVLAMEHEKIQLETVQNEVVEKEEVESEILQTEEKKESEERTNEENTTEDLEENNEDSNNEDSNKEESIKDNEEEIKENKIPEEHKENIELKEENSKEESELRGSKYELENTISIEKYRLNNSYERIEFEEDVEGLKSLYKLKKKTTAKYEIVLSESKDNYSFLGAFDEEEQGVELYNKEVKIKNNGLITIIDENGNIVYSQNSMGRIIKHINGVVDPTVSNVTKLYKDKELKKEFTYINHGYIDDVPVIENIGKAVKVKVAGFTGWIGNDIGSGNFDVVIVPLNQITNPSYYTVKNGELIHFISTDSLSSSKKGNEISLGKAPEYLKEGIKYYSYDGNYFYNSLESLVNNEKEGKVDKAVNSTKKYYNYYSNLPYRSKTNFTAAELNDFIMKNTKSTSKLRDSGEAFINAQNKYGVNALIMLGIAINESGWGMSSIAQSKNNIFGINAVDTNPGEVANSFSSVGECINEFAKNYISKGYADPASWKFFGGILGNKGNGTNVKYASDPFWGEKATAHGFKADKSISGNNLSNLKDFDYYQLAITNSNENILDSKGNLLYKVNEVDVANSAVKGVPFIIKADYRNNGWVRIAPDRTTAINYSDKNNSFHGEYDWNFKAYTKANGLSFVNNGREIGEEYSGVLYQSYNESTGWQDWVKDSETVGTAGLGKRIEAIKIKGSNLPEGVKIQYRVHAEGTKGFGNWLNEGEIAGLAGSNKRIEAIQIRLIGENSYKYNIQYRVHGEDYGWQSWFKDSETAGTMGQSKRIEAMEIRIVETKIKEEKPRVQYVAQCEDYGWLDWTTEGKLGGTLGESKRMESLKIKIENNKEDLSLRYSSHVEGGVGFEDWRKEEEITGTVGQSKRMEAIKIELTGASASKYDIVYRVHGQDYGWQDWKKNGEIAGTLGQSRRIEGIEIKIVEK